ncbi:flavin reductase family protein [Methylocapsa sp. S129]|uniref:flavin reductase family protein n=1 Tax=Methylocapsa sp. S129 TaxID=1641869 RepID=UPI00131C1787|nr:flavin reductase family protein [Methylocapsa sp. S129]
MGATLKNAFVNGSSATPFETPREEFRAAMRELAGAVSVISCGEGERRVGFTATSVSSLSADPPTLILCINRASSSWPTLRAARSFGVNVLSASHRELAHRFAGRTGAEGAERYQGGHWITLATGAPLLSDALAAFDCSVEEIIERHSHAIVIGRIEAVRRRGGGGALVYWRGDYDQLGWSQDEISNAVGLARRS